MTDGNRMNAKIMLVRAAVWGQALGILAFATFLAIEDAPDYFARTSPWAIALPPAAIIAVHLRGAAAFVARSLSSGMLALFVLIPSVSTAAAATAYMLQAHSVPEFLVTDGWRYTRATSIALSVIFVLALVANIVLAIRLFRRDTTPSQAVSS
jgi:hypothetical protein